MKIDPKWSSFDKHEDVVAGEDGLLPLLAFFSLAMFNAFGMIPIPWILLSEVYPTKYVMRFIYFHLFNHNISLILEPEAWQVA